MEIFTKKEYEKLQRVTENEPLLWAGRPQSPLHRWASYRLDTIPSLGLILLIPPAIFFMTSPWAMLLFVLSIEVFAVGLAHRSFYNQAYAITDKHIWQIENFSARRPFVRKTPSIPGMRVSWTRYQDNLSTFKITFDLRLNGRTKRVLLVRFFDVADGIAAKTVLVRNFIFKKDPSGDPAPVMFARVASLQEAQA